MQNADWGTLAPELVLQNYTLVASFSVFVWDCLVTFPEEVTYIWLCPSRTTKYHFLLCRYYVLAYLILCLIFGIQWSTQIPNSAIDCRTWFFVHMISFSMLYLGGQWTIVRKVFHLYGRSHLLAGGLFALHFIQMASSWVATLRISRSMQFNLLCNKHKSPAIVPTIIVSLTFNQCITWSFILRKVQPELLPSWRTPGAQAKMSCAICLIAFLLGSSQSFSNQHLVSAYAFTFPLIVISIGTCRYVLRVEKERDARSKLSGSIELVESKGQQLAGVNRSHGGVLVKNQLSSEIPSPLSDPGALSIQTAESDHGLHDINPLVDSNFPYLHGAQSYKLKKSRRSTATFDSVISSVGPISECTRTNHSPRNSSDYANQRAVSVRTSNLRHSEAVTGPSARAEDAGDSHRETSTIASASSIEIGSLHFSSSADSEELHRFYNNVWSVGPYMATGS